MWVSFAQISHNQITLQTHCVLVLFCIDCITCEFLFGAVLRQLLCLATRCCGASLQSVVNVYICSSCTLPSRFLLIWCYVCECRLNASTAVFCAPRIVGSTHASGFSVRRGYWLVVVSRTHAARTSTSTALLPMHFFNFCLVFDNCNNYLSDSFNSHVALKSYLPVIVNLCLWVYICWYPEWKIWTYLDVSTHASDFSHAYILLVVQWICLIWKLLNHGHV